MYASVIVFTTILAIATTLYEINELNAKIFEMAYYETQVNILRSGKVQQKSSLDVVPGDIVFLDKQLKLPFDAVIL